MRRNKIRLRKSRICCQFAQIPNELLQARHDKFSCAAIIIAADIISRPDDWDTTVIDTAEHHKISRRDAQRACKQLADGGFARRLAFRTIGGERDGAFAGQTWEITQERGKFDPLPAGAYVVYPRHLPDRSFSDQSGAGPVRNASDNKKHGIKKNNCSFTNKERESAGLAAFPDDGRIRYGPWEAVARASLPQPTPELEIVGARFVAARLSAKLRLNAPDVESHFKNFCRRWRVAS